MTNEISVRVRTGDVVVDSSVNIAAQAFKLSLDAGSILVNGALMLQARAMPP